MARSALLSRVGARIAELRRLRGMTQEALAERLETNVKHLQRVERGEENLTLRTIEAVAAALRATPLDLMLAPAAAPRRTGRPRKVHPEVPLVLRALPDPARVTTAVPMLTLVAIAGESDATSPASFVDWVEVPGRRLARGLFIARVEGDSMAPRVPSGAHALFHSSPTGDLDGRIGLVEIAADGDAQAVYLLKRIQVVALDGDDRARIKLVSLNPRVRPRTLWTGPGTGVRVVAELVEVLGERGS